MRTAAVLAALLVGACRSTDSAPVRPLTETEQESARAHGAAAAAALQSTLAPRLLGAMEAGGVAEAVRFCSSTADSLTAAAAELSGFAVKRTSSRVRNPANAPDAWELLALGHFETLALQGDSLPAGWLQAVSDEEVRYYAPLMVAPLCVNCHGHESDLAPGVRAILEERYPDDDAIGYAPGDLRGLIRVSIPRRELDGSGG